MNFIQGTLQTLEVGKASILIRVVPLLTALGIIGQGFTTEFLRPHAVSQLRDYAVSQSLRSGRERDLFPADQFPPGQPRILPDTYNAPGYPYLLAGWFRLLHPEFEEPATNIGGAGMYAPERWIPLLNQIFLVLTAVIVFFLGRRLFDQRVAWMGLIAYLVSDLIWKFSLTALSTSFLIFLVTAALYCLQEIFSVGEGCFESEERTFTPAWFWGLLLALLLAVLCLTRLQFLILLVPVLVLLVVMPSARVLLGLLVTFLVIAAVTPWFIHLDHISGSFLGSNGPLVLHGLGEYKDNEIYCTTAIPSYEQLFADAVKKEYFGFRWNFEHAWTLLGSNPLVLLFGASILHQFKRRRTRLFHWGLFGSAIALLVSNNLGSENPEPLDPWNGLVVLMPAMIVVGSAFFFILLDRLNLQLWLLNNIVVVAVLLLTAMPLGMSVTTSSFYPFSFPPYWPPTIKTVAQLAQPDEWVTTDMPWATAWYGDRASLWLPDSLTDFENFHDNVCPTGMLLLTPVTWDAPMSNITTGEYKDWFPIITGVGVPQNFPLPEHYPTPGKIPSYTLWSDKPRWTTR
jgi:4-amino-4-deoxy-L-arabinose transferase-like glycosyltransferase